MRCRFGCLHRGSSRGFAIGRGIVVSDLVGEGIPTTYARIVDVRDRRRAKSAYEDLMKLWNGADPEIPILHQVNA
jgi:hypothetical protein